MRFFKAITSFILMFSIILNISIPAYAKQINQITDTSTYAKVMQVIDGDTLYVQLSNGDTAYVKLKGVDSKGYDDAYKYLSTTLLGQRVNLVQDTGSYNGGIYTYMIVYFNGQNINNVLLENGYAKIDTSQDKGGTYNSLVVSQNLAKYNLIGMWRFEDDTYSSITGSSVDSTYTADKVNINTATKNQLQTLLRGISSNLATEIVNYREKNPFSHISEIKFVPGFTKQLYDQNKNFLTVSTNINTANEYELKTLDNMSNADIQAIINRRNTSSFTSVSQLGSVLSYSVYSRISSYVSVKDVTTIDVTINSSHANISLSSKYYLTNAGASSTVADTIINYRKNGYTYKTLMELTKYSSSITEKDINALEDNFEVFTDLNTDVLAELTAIFASNTAQKIKDKTFTQKDQLKDFITSTEYDRVKDAVCIDTNKDEYINVNTATKEQMYSQGINTTDAYNLIQNRPITNPTKLPYDISHINNKISLYTNINTASLTELLSLNNGMTTALANLIIKYRELDNFGSLSEVEQFFKNNGQSSVYDKIKDYIVVR